MNYCLDNDLTQELIFSRRVNLEREKKLQEFNFKVLNNILPCGTNLKKWRIVDCNSCDVCNMEQTMIHLLFDCKYVNHVWNHVSTALGWNVEQHNIICGSTSENFQLDNIIITIISFLLYKEWLLCSLDNRKRGQLLNLQCLKGEIELRVKIYKHCKMDVNVAQLKTVLSYL